MNSLFSSFDAFCAESIGLKLRFSDPVAPRRSESALKITGEEIGNKSSAPAPVAEKSSSKKGNQRMKPNPRFAVELDGIHCFETILPY